MLFVVSDSDDAFAQAKWASSNVRSCSQEERKHRIEQVCEEWRKKGEHKCGMDRLSNIMVDDKHKTLYCEVPKAACTSWKMFFAELLGNITDDIRPVLNYKVHWTGAYEQLGFRFLNTYTPEEQLYRVQHYFKFLTVRNPIARMVSAYENKLERQHPDSQWYQKHIGTYIIKNYRRNPSMESLEKGHDVTFDELARFIANDKDKFFQRYDRHWNIEYLTCCPCMIKYDYIAKIETLAEDAKNIIERVVPGEGKTLPRSNVMNMAEEVSRCQKPLSTLKQNIVEKLLQHYSTDLRIFGYGVDTERKIFCNSGGEGENACC